MNSVTICAKLVVRIFSLMDSAPLWEKIVPIQRGGLCVLSFCPCSHSTHAFSIAMVDCTTLVTSMLQKGAHEEHLTSNLIPSKGEYSTWSI